MNRKKKMVSALVALASIALGHASPAEAAAPEHSSFNFKGDTVYANFWSYAEADNGVCGVSTGVDVSAYSHRSHTGPGAPGQGGYMSVYVYQYDSCTLQMLLSGYASTDDFELSTQGTKSAVLSATLELFDWSSNMSVPVEVNLALTGEGDAYHGMYSSFDRSGTYMVKQRSNGSFREASAVGSVLVSGENYADGEGNATLSTVQTGSISTYKL